MTHLIGTTKDVKGEIPKTHRVTKCRKVLHRKWVKDDAPVECQECWPTMDGMLKRLVGLAGEIKKARKVFGVKP